MTYITPHKRSSFDALATTQLLDAISFALIGSKVMLKSFPGVSLQVPLDII